jgi:putative transposase
MGCMTVAWLPASACGSNTLIGSRRGRSLRLESDRLGPVLSSRGADWQTTRTNAKTPSYHGYRFPPEIISHAVWHLLAKRGVIVSHETIRQWSRKFGAEYARKLKRREGRLGDTWHLDELFVTIQGERQMRRFKSAAQAQQSLSVHGVILNLFRVGRHLLWPANYRILRERSFLVWSEVTCA